MPTDADSHPLATDAAEAARADAMLTEMAAEAPTPLELVRARRQAEGGGGRQTLQRIRYTHEDCINRIIANPEIAQNDLAAIYGMSAAWMSIVINSDVFKARLAERRNELIDPALLVTLNERYAAVAAKSAEVILEKLNKPIDQISDRLAIEAAALGAKAMGMGEPKRSVSSDDHLAAIAHRLIDLNKSSQTPPPAADVIDVIPHAPQGA